MSCVVYVCVLVASQKGMYALIHRTYTRHTYINKQSVNDLIGADTETGGVWDPLGLSQNEASLRKYRECELKHGRIAMAAMLGIVTQTFYHLPDEVFNNPKPLAALQQVYSRKCFYVCV